MVDASTQTKPPKRVQLPRRLQQRQYRLLRASNNGQKLGHRVPLEQRLQTLQERNKRRQQREAERKGPLQKCSFGTCQRSKHTKQKGGWLCLWHQLTPTRAAKVGVHKLDNMAGTRLIRAIRQPYPLGWSLFACVDILPKQYITTYEGYLHRNLFHFVFPLFVVETVHPMYFPN